MSKSKLPPSKQLTPIDGGELLIQTQSAVWRRIRTRDPAEYPKADFDELALTQQQMLDLFPNVIAYARYLEAQLAIAQGNTVFEDIPF